MQILSNEENYHNKANVLRISSQKKILPPPIPHQPGKFISMLKTISLILNLLLFDVIFNGVPNYYPAFKPDFSGQMKEKD